MGDGCIKMYSPATIKKQITGNGRADKNEMIVAAQHIFNQTRSFNSHEADALAIAYTGWKLDLKA
jgi:Holliday junction resolvasome RuvABC endonuclease subunit